MNKKSEAIRMYFAGVGGQGSLTAAMMIGDAAASAGINVLASEIHGMAQRGGVVLSTLCLGNVHSAYIDDGDADVLVGFEPIETLRALAKCSKKTTVLMNIHPTIPFTVGIGMQKYPPVEDTVRRVKECAGELYTVDAEEVAKSAGTARAMGVVMLGVLSEAVKLPFSDEIFLKAITKKVPKKFIDANTKAFKLGKSNAKLEAN